MVFCIFVDETVHLLIINILSYLNFDSSCGSLFTTCGFFMIVVSLL